MKYAGLFLSNGSLKKFIFFLSFRKHQTASKHKARQEAEKLEAKLRREAKEAKEAKEDASPIVTPIEEGKEVEETKK